MSLSERSRSSLYTRLVDVVGDERAVSEMLSYFPARDVEEPLTKEFSRAEMAIRDAEIQAEFATVRSEMADGFASLRAEMLEGSAALRAEMHAGFQRQMVWSVSTMLAFATVLITALALLR